MRGASRSFLTWLLLLAVCLGQEGLKIDVLREGAGRTVEDGQMAVVGYSLKAQKVDVIIETATIIEPFSFELGSPSVIKGFNQGVRGMKIGEKRKVLIPPSLGYGSKDYGNIPANSTLVFEVELFQIKANGSLKGELAPSATASSGQPELNELMVDDAFLKKRHAQDIVKPAMFEYLIREFFTKPWRFSDGHVQVWRESIPVLVVLIALLGFTFLGYKRGFLTL